MVSGPVARIITIMTNISRQQPGQPTGWQFAATSPPDDLTSTIELLLQMTRDDSWSNLGNLLHSVSQPITSERQHLTPDDLALVAELYALGFVVPFDWMGWGEGRNLLAHPDLLASVTAVDAVKLLTVCIRSDRFVDGALLADFQAGTIQSLVGTLINFASQPRT